MLGAIKHPHTFYLLIYALNNVRHTNYFVMLHLQLYIQGVSEIRVLILTSGRTRQFMKLFLLTFCKIRKSFPRCFAPLFLPNESFFAINLSVFFFNFNYLIVSITM
jgi:hypothetical protein